MLRRSAFFAALLLCVPALLAQQPPRSADLVVRGGKVITVDSSGTIASGVAVVAGHIAAVGEASDINAWIGPQTRVIELNGRTLLPGFIDAHSHVLGLAESEHAMVPIQAPPLKGSAEII